MIALVAGLSSVAAAVVVGAVVLSSDEDEKAAKAPEPLAGAPPLVLDVAVRPGEEGRQLRTALALYEGGRRPAAGRIFARLHSREAQVGEALASWPDNSLERLEQLGGLFPRDPAVQLNLGLARFWAQRGDPVTAWRTAAERGPDTLYAVAAGNLLHREYARDLPVFIPSFDAPSSIVGLAPREQLEALRRLAGGGDVRGRLLYGTALQRLGRQRSAERVYAEAAAEAPANAEAQVAAAVGLFDKDDITRSFSHLGPLARRFPNAATVRFHLGLLLLWTGRIEEAKRQLRLASNQSGPLAGEARRYLNRVEKARTS